MNSSKKKISWRKYELIRDVTYYSPRYRKSISGEKGFIFDGYTMVPQLPDLRPSLFHDLAYAKKTWDDGTPISRKEADMIFLDLMESSESKITRLFSSVYYRGVRMFSGWFWKNKEKK